MRERTKRAICTTLFVSYTIFIMWCTLLKRYPRKAERVFVLEIFWAIRTWIAGGINGKEESIQYINNIFLFIPYGFLFPWKKNWKAAVVVTIIVSASIEILQFIFNLGWCEVDDVISNTVGTCVGLFLYKRIKERGCI